MSDLMPPPELTRIGRGDFRKIGQAFLRHFVELGGLKPTDRVLDLGCGIGRMAIPLTQFLTPPGSYDGLDLQVKAIDWCDQNITPLFPNFRFHKADIRNFAYNPQGSVAAAEYSLPWSDGTFDFAILTSLFTHLLPADMEPYTAELARVLRPGGRALVTWFLIGEESMRLSDVTAAKLSFRHDRGVFRLNDETVPEAAVGYDEAYVRQTLAASGLSVVEPVHYGTWCGRPGGQSYQDIVVVSRRQ